MFSRNGNGQQASLGEAARLLLRGGMRMAAICRELGVSRATVYRWLGAARLEDLERFSGKPPRRFEPLFPVDSFTKRSKCPHHGPIPPGSSFVCMVCHQSAYDWHPDIKRPA